MSLGRIVLVVAVILGVLFSFGAWVALRVTVLPAFGDLELDSAERDRNRIVATMSADLGILATFNQEYSTWTQSHLFARGENLDFVEEELSPGNWQTSSVDLILYFDRHDRLLYSWLGDPLSGEELDISEELPRDFWILSRRSSKPYAPLGDC
jgi:sensor domain CHASE-containing protein